MGWYDRKLRRVRDLSCGDTRVYLEFEVRRLDCRGCGAVKRGANPSTRADGQRVFVATHDARMVTRGA